MTLNKTSKKRSKSYKNSNRKSYTKKIGGGVSSYIGDDEYIILCDGSYKEQNHMAGACAILYNHDGNEIKKNRTIYNISNADWYNNASYPEIQAIFNAFDIMKIYSAENNNNIKNFCLIIDRSSHWIAILNKRTKSTKIHFKLLLNVFINNINTLFAEIPGLRLHVIHKSILINDIKIENMGINLLHNWPPDICANINSPDLSTEEITIVNSFESLFGSPSYLMYLEDGSINTAFNMNNQYNINGQYTNDAGLNIIMTHNSTPAINSTSPSSSSVFRPQLLTRQQPPPPQPLTQQRPSKKWIIYQYEDYFWWECCSDDNETTDHFYIDPNNNNVSVDKKWTRYDDGSNNYYWYYEYKDKDKTRFKMFYEIDGIEINDNIT